MSGIQRFMTLARLLAHDDMISKDWVKLYIPGSFLLSLEAHHNLPRLHQKNWDACDYLLVQRHSGFIPFQLLFGPETPPVPPDDYSLVQRHIPLQQVWCWVHCCFRGVTSSSLQFWARSPHLKIKSYLYTFSLSQISCLNKSFGKTYL